MKIQYPINNKIPSLKLKLFLFGNKTNGNKTTENPNIQ